MWTNRKKIINKCGQTDIKIIDTCGQTDKKFAMQDTNSDIWLLVYRLLQDLSGKLIHIIIRGIL